MRDVAFQREQALGSVQQIKNFGAHGVYRQEATPGRFTLTCLQTISSPHMHRIVNGISMFDHSALEISPKFRDERFAHASIAKNKCVETRHLRQSV